MSYGDAFWKNSDSAPAEVFNLPNHLNPTAPVDNLNASNASLTSGNFGTITQDMSGTGRLSAGDPRIIQLAMKFVF
jgi:hypothetical protein